MANARADTVLLVVVASLVSTCLGSVGTGAEGTSSAEYDTSAELIDLYEPLVVTTDKSSYLPGEPVNVTGMFPRGFVGTFSDGCTMYYMIIDSDGNVIYDMRKHYYWVMVITTLAVGPGYSRSFIWNQQDDSGKQVASPMWLQAVVVVPAWGNPLMASTEFSINPMPASFDIALSPGWNLISMPIVNDSWSAGRIGLGQGSIVVAWDAETQSYSNSFITGVSPDFADYKLMPGRSYFVWSPQGQSLSLRGCSPDFYDAFSLDLNVPSGGGWICLGFNSLGPGFDASGIPGLVKRSNVLVVCCWNPISALYDTYVPGLSPPSKDFAVGPGDGCWLLLDGPATLTYSP